MEKKKIIFDFDDVIVRGDFLKIANECFKENKKIDDLTSYYIEENFNITKEERDRYLDMIVNRNVYENATLVEGAYETLQKLANDSRFDVMICSVPIIRNRERLSAKLFANKFNFIMENLPFIDPNNIILCGNKSILVADYMIDDKVENLESNENVDFKILFPAYHNKDLSKLDMLKKGIIKANDYNYIYNFIVNGEINDPFMDKAFKKYILNNDLNLKLFNI